MLASLPLLLQRIESNRIESTNGLSISSISSIQKFLCFFLIILTFSEKSDFPAGRLLHMCSLHEEIRRILQSNQSEKGHEQDVLERYLLDVQCEFGCCLTACGNHLFACGTVYPQFFERDQSNSRPFSRFSVCRNLPGLDEASTSTALSLEFPTTSAALVGVQENVVVFLRQARISPAQTAVCP